MKQFRWVGVVSILVVLWTGCDGIFPAQDKEGPPADHTVSQGGALHKPGLDEPFSRRSQCSDAACHHADLRGGAAEVDGRLTVAPSCYQCHGREWEDSAPSLCPPDPLSVHNNP